MELGQKVMMKMQAHMMKNAPPGMRPQMGHPGMAHVMGHGGHGGPPGGQQPTMEQQKIIQLQIF